MRCLYSHMSHSTTSPERRTVQEVTPNDNVNKTKWRKPYPTDVLGLAELLSCLYNELSRPASSGLVGLFCANFEQYLESLNLQNPYSRIAEANGA